MRTHVARDKDHRCDACGKRIPIGARYFVDETTDYHFREHTNCIDFQSEPELEAGYNHNRSLGERDNKMHVGDAWKGLMGWD